MKTGKYRDHMTSRGELAGTPDLTGETGQRVSRRSILQRGVGVAVVTAGIGTFIGLERGRVWAAPPPPPPTNPVIQWNNAALQAIGATATGPTIGARALAIAHTAMYDAWATYSANSVPTQHNGIPRQKDKNGTNATQALSFAAYRALVDLFPTQMSTFNAVMNTLGYKSTDTSTNTSTPTGVGNVAAQAILTYRHQDGSNQIVDASQLSGVGYPDSTGYTPTLGNPDHWQPLSGQSFLTPHWGQVKPFALSSSSQFRPSGPIPFSSTQAFKAQVDAALSLSAGLNDTSKVIAEYWADGPKSVTPPGHWDLLSQFVLAQYVSKKYNKTLNDDVMMFFGLTNAIFDASIACWECKRYYDSCRPISAVPAVYPGATVTAWAGPGQGTQTFPSNLWKSYIKTPAFPEYVSGHSTFSAAGAYILSGATGSDTFGNSYTAAAGSSSIEPGITPGSSVTLSWPTFSSAATQAGMSRRYGGIHFQKADEDGRALGQQVAALAGAKALSYINGTV
jgi:hypothetical protein